MTYKIRLDIRKSQERAEGFPVVFEAYSKGKKIRFSIGVNLREKEWDQKNRLPATSSKYYLFVKKKKLIAETLLLDFLMNGSFTLQEFKNRLLTEKNEKSTSFYDFAEILIAELLQSNRNGSAKMYKYIVDELKKYKPELQFNEIDYNFLNGFKEMRLKIGNSKNTITVLFRLLRAIYNEACNRNVIENAFPFRNVFAGILQKSNRNKKRYLSKESIMLLENATGLKKTQQQAVDLFLLMFYFGGQDLIDLYYLEKKQIANGRIFFQRKKLSGNGYEFDLKITPKAQKIIDKYAVKGPHVFPGKKEYESYVLFYRRFRNGIAKAIQQLNAVNEQKIEVLPKGGTVTVKVARHSFATIGKQLFIDTDLLRELMGHERNEMDTIYKDRFPESVRDEAHGKIIG
jgi:site-specific recombinase XerD